MAVGWTGLTFRRGRDEPSLLVRVGNGGAAAAGGGGGHGEAGVDVDGCWCASSDGSVGVYGGGCQKRKKDQVRSIIR